MMVLRWSKVSFMGVFLLALFLLLGCESSTESVSDCALTLAPGPSSNPDLSEETLFLVETIEMVSDQGTMCMIVEDMDGDSYLDIFLGIRNGETPRVSFTPGLSEMDQNNHEGGLFQILWGKEGDGFEPATLEFPPGVAPSGGCIASDVNGDGRLDILAGTFSGGVIAFHGQEGRVFDSDMDLVTFPDEHSYQRTAVLAHVDLDGVDPPDLFYAGYGWSPFVCEEREDPGGGVDVQIPASKLMGADVYCFVGTEDGHFVEAPPGVCPSNMSEATVGAIWSIGVSDINRDMRPDIVIGNDFAENMVLMSQKGGGLRDETDAAGIRVFNHAMGFAFADFDQDGTDDMYITDIGPDQLWKGTACGGYTDFSQESQVALLTDRGLAWGVQAQDFDQDGDVDVFVANGLEVGPGDWAKAGCEAVEPDPLQSHYLLMNDGQGQFERIRVPQIKEIEDGFEEPIILSSGDLDKDGDMDLVMMEHGGVSILWNVMAQPRHWLSVRPLKSDGTPALGAQVLFERKDGSGRAVSLYGNYGLAGHSALTAHVGLGTDDSPVHIRVRWSDGTYSEYGDVSVDRHLTVKREAL